MLGTRLWMGTVLILLTAGMLALDQQLAPWYPFLFFLVLSLGLAACFELIQLLGPVRQPQPWLCYLGVAVLVIANWLAHLPGTRDIIPYPLAWVLGTFSALLIAVFLVEMARFREPGESVPRMALTLWIISYLGLLPSFLAQIRWLNPRDPNFGTMALALTIFVPKCCDIGAYFTGRFLGRHPMTPVLSPKKTWEGAAGGLAIAAATAVALDRLGPAGPLQASLACEIGFGLTVGAAGMLGDLAESLIKRDCLRKDASQVVPGFGGVLDVVDAVLFAAPVAFLWFFLLGRS
jgi:phosphatidate cytidylyltransferase